MTEKENQKPASNNKNELQVGPNDWKYGLIMLFSFITLISLFFSKIFALYVIGIAIMFIPLKKWYIPVITGLAIWILTYFLATSIYKIPTINITSPLEGNSQEYILKGEVENFSEISINGEKIETTGKNFEKNIVLENLETKVKINIKNGFLRDSEKEIIVKRNKTEEEVKAEQEKIAQEEKEKAEKERQKQEKIEAEKAELPKKKFEEQRSFNARYACEQGVKTILKSPKTAKFDDVKAWWAGDGIGMVTGTVTAQNSFGALISNKYKCKFTWQADKEDFSYTYEIVQ